MRLTNNPPSFLKSIGLCSLLMIVIIGTTFAQDQTVTLTTTGQGENLQQATDNALRSAIEQAFGAFISTRTEILNDDLIADEIVSISNGNIQSYELIADNKINDELWAITVTAVVSVTKLTSFVQARGVQVEIQGGMFAANIRQQLLNEQNEAITMSNIAETAKAMLDVSCDFDLTVGSPKQSTDNNWLVPINVNVYFNENINQFQSYLINSLLALRMKAHEIDNYTELEKGTFKVALGTSNTRDPIFHFRSLETVIKLIDIIEYTKQCLTNFEINNSINTITYESLVGSSDRSVRKPNLNFRVSGTQLYPIFNIADRGHNRGNQNGPESMFANSRFLYHPITKYDDVYYYYGIQIGYSFRGEASRRTEAILNKDYGFLITIDNDVPNPGTKPSGFWAVISLEEYNLYTIKSYTEYIQSLQMTEDEILSTVNDIFDQFSKEEREQLFGKSILEEELVEILKKEQMEELVNKYTEEEYYAALAPLTNNNTLIVQFSFEDKLTLDELQRLTGYSISATNRR